MSKYKLEIKWALIFFAVGLLWMVFEKIMGWHNENIADHATYTNFFAIPAIVIYVLALLDKRKNIYGGFMSWKQGLISGLIITGVVAILSPVSQLITSYVISPEYFTNIHQYSVSNSLMTEEQATSEFTIGNYIIINFVFAIVTGIVTSAIVALFTMKRQKVNPDLAG